MLVDHGFMIQVGLLLISISVKSKEGEQLSCAISWFFCVTLSTLITLLPLIAGQSVWGLWLNPIWAHQ